MEKCSRQQQIQFFSRKIRLLGWKFLGLSELRIVFLGIVVGAFKIEKVLFYPFLIASLYICFKIFLISTAIVECYIKRTKFIVFFISRGRVARENDLIQYAIRSVQTSHTGIGSQMGSAIFTQPIDLLNHQCQLMFFFSYHTQLLILLCQF